MAVKIDCWVSPTFSTKVIYWQDSVRKRYNKYNQGRQKYLTRSHDLVQFSRSTLLLSENLHRVARISVCLSASDPLLICSEKTRDKLLGFWLS